jgi:hypothetical protein
MLENLKLFFSFILVLNKFTNNNAGIFFNKNSINKKIEKIVDQK